MLCCVVCASMISGEMQQERGGAGVDFARCVVYPLLLIKREQRWRLPSIYVKLNMLKTNSREKKEAHRQEKSARPILNEAAPLVMHGGRARVSSTRGGGGRVRDS